jgi:hypothetical protein
VRTAGPSLKLRSVVAEVLLFARLSQHIGMNRKVPWEALDHADMP